MWGRVRNLSVTMVRRIALTLEPTSFPSGRAGVQHVLPNIRGICGKGAFTVEVFRVVRIPYTRAVDPARMRAERLVLYAYRVVNVPVPPCDEILLGIVALGFEVVY